MIPEPWQPDDTSDLTDDYGVVRGPLSTFVVSVKKLMAHGWEPLGGLSVTHDGPIVQYHQAMIKRV